MSLIRRVLAVTQILLILYVVPVVAAGRGVIRGSVVDRESGEPLVFASIVLEGTTLGTMTIDNGRFEMTVPAGTYALRVMMMGYKKASRPRLVVNDGDVVTLDFKLETIVVTEVHVIDVFATRKLVETRKPNVIRNMDDEEFGDIPVETILEVSKFMPGVIEMDGQYMVQGGRPGESVVLVDGVRVVDPLTNQSLGVGRFAAAGIEMQAGGMDAEYGDAQSAIIEIQTREGGKVFGGEFRYMTDDFGRADKTYTNYDNVSLGFGGPTFIDGVRYYVSADAAFSDGENTSIEPRHEYKVTDWLKARERMSRDYNLQSKLSWLRPSFKMTGEFIAQRSRHEEYHHNWNVQGYSRKVYYFQRLIPSGTGSDHFIFGGLSLQYEGTWLDKVRDPGQQPNPRPVVVEQVVRDPDTGEQHVIVHTNFRAVDAGGVTILWDEHVTASGAGDDQYKPWTLFEGFQFPFSSFSNFQDDSSYVFFNSATRTPEVTSRDMQLKLAFNHNITDNLLYEIRFSRLEFNRGRSVGGKSPGQYDTAGLPVTLPNGTYLQGGVSTAYWYTDPNHPYFVTAYDYPYYSDQRTVQYVTKGDLTSLRFCNHAMKTGFQAIYNDLAMDERLFPGQQRVNSETGEVQQGLNVNQFRNFNAEGAFYAKDKWDYEGLAVSAGLRFEFMTTGSASEIQINNEDVDKDVETFKYNWAPRLGIAFPISDRNKFFFNYGRYTQWPSRAYLFASQDAIATAATLGNPNLNPELTVSYQAGVSHQFTNDVVANFVVFNKDIYGLVSSTAVTDDSTGIRSLRYINKAYASARGLEVSLEKRMTRRFAFRTYYTFAFADGVASDADFGRSAEGLTHLPTDELPLDWDQRHTFNVILTLADRNNWGATATFQYGSGLPWTPEDRFARLQDPTLENSRRHPSTHRIDLQGRKRFNIYGRELTLFVEGRNLLDESIPRRFGERPGVTPAMSVGEMDNGAYLTETGRYGGAYLLDVDDDGMNDFVPVNDPTVFQAHRSWRMGVGFQF